MAKRILFIDDEDDLRFVMKTLLEKEGYDVEISAEAPFMDDPASFPHPDLYLLDRHLNGVDLLNMCRQLKSTEATRHIPVIMVSADPRLHEIYQEAKADAFIPKPFDIPVLLQQVKDLLVK